MSLMPITELRHLQRNDAWIEAIEGWQQSRGAERAYWRRILRREIQIERRRIADYTAWLRAQQTQQMREAA